MPSVDAVFGIDVRRALFPPRGWRRAVALRRAVAAALVVLAAVLALAPRTVTPSRQVVVATHDLPAGVPLTASDLAVRPVPADAVPGGALADPAVAVGRLLVGGMRTGETLTDVRLLGRTAAIAALRAPDAAGVPLRLSDPAVAGLLTAGSRVDVVGVGARSGTVASPRPGAVPRAGHASIPAAGEGDASGTEADPGGPGVLAAGAVVLGVLPAAERSATGPVVVVALPGGLAARVAAASLSQEVTVTLR